MAGGVHGRRHAWQGVMHGRGACMAGGVRGRKNGNCSGQYASYWNAFLLHGILDLHIIHNLYIHFVGNVAATQPSELNVNLFSCSRSS